MDFRKIKNDLLRMSYVDERGIICHSYSTITLSTSPSLSPKMIRQSHLPYFMILSICNDKLHISKASAMGNFKKYFGALYLNKLTFIKSFHKEHYYIHEFIYELENGTTVSFYINCVFNKPEVLRVVEEIKNYEKKLPLNNNCGFTIDPNEWYPKKYDYLNELLMNKQHGKLMTHIVVYHVLRLIIDEIDKFGFLYFFNNLFINLSKDIDLDYCFKLVNNSMFNDYINKAFEIIKDYDFDDLNLSVEDLKIIDELNIEFNQYKYHFIDEIDSYYKKSYNELKHSGDLLVAEMQYDNVASNLCKHLKPIFDYELMNNNKVQKSSLNSDNDQYKVDLVWEIKFDQKDNLSNEVDFLINEDSIQKGYHCNICNNYILGPLNNSHVKYIKPEKPRLKYFMFMILALIISIAGGSFLGFMLFLMFSSPEDNFSSPSFINFMILGIGFGLVLLIVNIIKSEKN